MTTTNVNAAPFNPVTNPYGWSGIGSTGVGTLPTGQFVQPTGQTIPGVTGQFQQNTWNQGHHPFAFQTPINTFGQPINAFGQPILGVTPWNTSLTNQFGVTPWMTLNPWTAAQPWSSINPFAFNSIAPQTIPFGTTIPSLFPSFGATNAFGFNTTPFSFVNPVNHAFVNTLGLNQLASWNPAFQQIARLGTTFGQVSPIVSGQIPFSNLSTIPSMFSNISNVGAFGGQSLLNTINPFSTPYNSGIVNPYSGATPNPWWSIVNPAIHPFLGANSIFQGAQQPFFGQTPFAFNQSLTNPYLANTLSSFNPLSTSLVNPAITNSLLSQACGVNCVTPTNTFGYPIAASSVFGATSPWNLTNAVAGTNFGVPTLGNAFGYVPTGINPWQMAYGNVPTIGAYAVGQSPLVGFGVTNGAPVSEPAGCVSPVTGMGLSREAA